MSNNQEISLMNLLKYHIYFFENNSSRSDGRWKVVTPEDLPASAGPGSVEKKEEENI